MRVSRLLPHEQENGCFDWTMLHHKILCEIKKIESRSDCSVKRGFPKWIRTLCSVETSIFLFTWQHAVQKHTLIPLIAVSEWNRHLFSQAGFTFECECKWRMWKRGEAEHMVHLYTLAFAEASNRPYINVFNVNSFWSTNSWWILVGGSPNVRRIADCCLHRLGNTFTLINLFVFAFRVPILFAFRCKPSFILPTLPKHWTLFPFFCSLFLAPLIF